MSIEWLKRALDETRISQAELAEAMGLSPDKVSKLLNGKRQLKADEMAAARAFFAARGRPLVRSFDPDDPDPVQSFEAEAPDNLDPDGVPRLPVDGIAEVDVRAGLGPGGELQVAYRRDGEEVQAVDAVKPDPWMFPPWFMRDVLRAKAKDILAIETQGDSMLPTIEPGAVVFVDTRHRIPSPDGVYAIRDRWGQIQVKRLETFGEVSPVIRIVSDNGGRSVNVPADDVVIVGRVIAAWRRL